MSGASIAIAASSRDWSLGLHRFVADHGGARVRLRVMHPEDAFDEDYDVLVIDDITSFLSAHFVHQVQTRDRKVLGVFEEAAGQQRLEDLGVNAVVSTAASPEDFVAIIVKLADQRNVDEEFADLLAEFHEAADAEASADLGRLIVVCGAGGGVGATEVAVGLAADFARRGIDTFLVDADDIAPAVAQRLDLALHPNLRTALDFLQHRTACVEDALLNHPSGFWVLAGLPNARDWQHIRPGDALDVVTGLNHGNRAVVVNISSLVEQEASRGGQGSRFGVGRLLLAPADEIVLVGGHTPVSVARILDWAADTKRLIDNKPLHLFINRVEDSAFVRGEVEAELRSVLQPATVTFAPNDPVTARAAWEGVPSGHGSLTKAVGALADHLVPTLARTRRRLIGS